MGMTNTVRSTTRARICAVSPSASRKARALVNSTVISEKPMVKA